MDIASGALYKVEEDNVVKNEAFYMKEESNGVRNIISNFENSQKAVDEPSLSKKQKKKLKKRKIEEGIKNAYEEDESPDITTKGGQNDKPVDNFKEEQNDDNMPIDYLNEQSKYPPKDVLTVDNQPVKVSIYKQNNQPMDVSEGKNQDNQETMNLDEQQRYRTGENSNKRGSEEENDSTKKIKTIAKKYPKGSKIKYYDRFRRQIRHQQRLRGYLHLYLGTPTVMGETYDWTIKYYPRDNLNDPLESEMKIDTWKLVILENKPAERPTSKENR
ncbi:hypothetical protein TNCV_1699611 [Trichonephila clavipes]|nr:hypothetical protein TNCV_1699611 [Trichonephila clavipes]